MELMEELLTEPSQLESCCDYLAKVRHFGLDTEFVGEETYHPSLCLIQVATTERLILIDPLTVGSLEGFWRLVMDPGNLVVVHAGREEARICQHLGGQPPGNFFDIQIAAGLVGHAYPLSHGSLVGQLLRVQLTKAETLTEWRTRPLTHDQIRYAMDDVRYLLPLWNILAKRLEQLNRPDWAREEFQRLSASANSEEILVEKWRRLRGLGSLDRRRLAVVRDIFCWREEEAARVNRPARTVVRDDLIVEISRRNPSRPQDLEVIRGLAKRNLAAIFQIIQRARAIPLADCPDPAEREQDPPQVGMVTSVLMAVLGDVCNRMDLAANLVASTQDVKNLVRAQLSGVTNDIDSSLCHGWRSRHVLPELQAILQGRRSVRVADLTHDTPFAYDGDS